MEVQVMQDILGKNDRIAAENQALFADKKIFVLNLLGSPGSGKTTLLEHTMSVLKDEIPMAVIEGDLFTSKDADRIAKYDVPVIQINTSGGCHLDDGGKHEHRRRRGADRCGVCRSRFGAEPLANGRLGDAARR